MTPVNPEQQAGNPIIATGFRQEVLATVAGIPAGRVLAYGEVARLSGHPGRARQVGRLLSTLPADTVLPWHRVLCADGRLAFPADSGAGQEQKLRLLAEGVQFRGQRVVAGHFWSAAGRRAT